MSNGPAFMDFDEPGPPDWLKVDLRKAGKHEPAGDEGKEISKPPVLRLPRRDPPIKSTEVVRGVSQRAKACANMRLEGASFQEIAEVLEYADAKEAKRDCTRALAATHPSEDWETMRQVEVMRAERLFKQSLAMASADYLIDPDGDRVPNSDKLKWHQQAASDLMNHATISGAKAPSKLEITPGEEQLEQLVEKLLERGGYEVMQEAEVLELTQIPRLEEGDEDDVDTYAEI